MFKSYFRPSLVEPGTHYFLSKTLENCHKFKEVHYNSIYNIALFGFFVLVLIVVLVCKWKGKLTKEEIQQKEYEKQQYILEKVKAFKDAKLKAKQSLITGLPYYDNEFGYV